MKTLSLATLAVASALFVTLAHAEPAAKMAGGVLVITSGMTLYTFDVDVAGTGKKAGDVTGDNFKDVWHVIK